MLSKCDDNYKPTDLKPQRNISTRNMKRTMLKHIIIKLLKTSDWEKILKAASFKKTCYTQRAKKTMAVDFSLQTVQQENSGATSLKC